MRSESARTNDHHVEKIIFFTIAVNSRDSVLAQTLEWIKAFAGIFKEVNVFTLYIGDTDNIPRNVNLIKFGGDNLRMKLVGMLRAFRQLARLLQTNDSILLYHMITWPVIIFGPIAKMTQHKQGVWYSHNYADLPLRITKPLVDKYFSPTINSFPLRNKSKLVAGGHSIDFKEFPSCTEKNRDWHLNRIVCIGRITPVKRIELLFEALSESNLKHTRHGIQVELIGSIQDRKYLKLLKKTALSLGVELIISKPLVRAELITSLKNVYFIFNGTPSSVDKSAIEACATGAIPITKNIDLMKLTGASTFWQNSKFAGVPSVYEQIGYLLHADSDELVEFSSFVQQVTRSQNDVKSKVNLIRSELL